LGRSVLGPGVVPVLSESPGGVRSAGPARPGQHNEDVYVRLLGRSAAEIESLRVQGVL
ncbi:CoA transferase, partial [Mycolicibacter hiberniae]|nr:CoA transferase [Mycolicibacter hiberniae]